MRRLFFYSLWLCFLVNVSFAQGEVGAKPKPAKLPRAFAAFSNDEVLKKVFSDYNAKTGRVASIINDEQLDLAPYKLNSNETLIGFRVEHMWLPAKTWATYLSLYRIEGDQLREVFGEAVVDREFPGESPSGEIIKTVSVLSPIASHSNFYDYEIRKTITHCFDNGDDADCNAKHDKIKSVKTQTEWWRFNGTRFEKVKK
ncbi:MAG: hypothetical protein HY231_22860 [Acidobacteria bacterium]|nr:hypothetical protein [Acidobacteriota bacterium]